MDAPDAMTITDVNNDCLEALFLYLVDLDDVLNVAMASPLLRPALAIAYARTFGRKRVELIRCNQTLANMRPKVSFSVIQIYGLRRALRCLRFFGAAIRRILIKYNKSTNVRYNYVHQYINEYCADTLTSIMFCHMPNIAIEPHFRRPFPMLQSIYVRHCDFGHQWPSIFRIFPQIRSFSMDVGSMRRRQTTSRHFIAGQNRRLTSIQIRLFKGFTSNRHLVNLFQMSRRLTSMDLFIFGIDFAMDTLLQWIRWSQSLSTLSVEYTRVATIPVDAEQTQQLITEHPALIVLDLARCCFNADDALLITRELDSLKEFRFKMLRADHIYFVTQLAVVWRIQTDPVNHDIEHQMSITLNR